MKASVSEAVLGFWQSQSLAPLHSQNAVWELVTEEGNEIPKNGFGSKIFPVASYVTFTVTCDPKLAGVAHGVMVIDRFFSRSLR